MTVKLNDDLVQEILNLLREIHDDLKVKNTNTSGNKITILETVWLKAIEELFNKIPTA